MTRSSLVTAVLIAATLVAAARFGAAVYNAPASAQGDFRASLPGAHAQALNPTLWNSDDLRGSLGYQRDLYVYGPTQYLLLYPSVFLDSYAGIARVLGFVYGGVLACALYLLSRLVAGSRWSVHALLVVAAVCLMFAPFYQTYIQREFEVVVFFLLIAATCLLVSRRDGWAGAILGVMTWFKLWPVVFLGYFLAKKQFRAAAAFALASCLTLGAAQFLFGLDRFVLFNPEVSASLPGREFVLSGIVPPVDTPAFYRFGPGAYNATGRGFCKNWNDSDQTTVGVRWAVCSLAFKHRWLPAPLVFYGLVLAFGMTALFSFVRIARAPALATDDERWTITCEVSLLTIGAALMFSAHYYYFIFLTLPICALVFRYERTRQWAKLALLAGAYIVLAGFLLPLSVMSRFFADFWRFYLAHVLYFYGELLLIALLLWEYAARGLRHGTASHAQFAGEVLR